MKLDLFNKQLLKEQNEKISRLSASLSVAESKNIFYEKKLALLETQMDDLCQHNLPKASGFHDTKHQVSRVSFEFNFDFYRRTPEILRYVGERVIAEALKKCDSWERLYL